MPQVTRDQDRPDQSKRSRQEENDANTACLWETPLREDPDDRHREQLRNYIYSLIQISYTQDTAFIAVADAGGGGMQTKTKTSGRLKQDQPSSPYPSLGYSLTKKWGLGNWGASSFNKLLAS